MTAADAIAALGPVAHWVFDDATTDSTIGGVINEFVATNEAGPIPPTIPGYHATADALAAGAAEDPPITYIPPCGGDLMARPDFPLFSARDHRGPRGTYSWNEDGDEIIETEALTVKADIPFVLFSQAFTVIMVGGNMQSRRFMRGVGPLVNGADESGDNCPNAAVVWFGSGVASPGYEDSTGGWFGLGTDNRTEYPLSIGSKVWLGSGLDYVGSAFAEGFATEVTDGRQIVAFTYDPDLPLLERSQIWVDGDRASVGIVSPAYTEAALAFAYECLATQPDAKMLFWGGWDNTGVEYYVIPEGADPIEDEPEDGWPIATEYPWHASYAGVVSNIAILDYAATTAELKALFIDANGGLDTCAGWNGPVPVAVIAATHLTGYDFELDASDSYAFDATIVAWEWKVVYPNPYPPEGTTEPGVPVVDVVFSTDEINTTPFVRSDVFGNGVMIQLKVTDSDGLEGFDTKTIYPPQPGQGGWSVGHIGIGSA